MSIWYKNSGKESDIVLSSRIRLARNISGIPFPAKWSDSEAKTVMDSVKNAITVKYKDFEFLNLDNTPEINKHCMIEDHIMSKEMLSGKNKAVLLSHDSEVSVMLGEEDHIRLQVILGGLALDDAYKRAEQLDDVIGTKVDYAFDEQLGFLTRCPTNVGTALRASVMLHLPATRLAGRINQLSGEVGKLGLTIRGLYGEGSDSAGDLYQLSNQITLGIDEVQTIEKLKKITEQIITSERSFREQIAKKSPDALADKVYRALGTLKFARTMSSNECKILLSSVRLGISLGIIKEVDINLLGSLMINTEPAHISHKYGDHLDANERDIKRCELIKEILK